MQDYKREEYKVFELFDKKWALVTAGNIQHYNCCTVSWGSLGNIWGTAGNSRSTVTVYVHPARYTSEVLKESDIFTVSFYPETSRKALGYLGSHSGRNENKIETVGFTNGTGCYVWGSRAYLPLQETVSAPVLTGRLSTGNPSILCGETRSLSGF